MLKFHEYFRIREEESDEVASEIAPELLLFKGKFVVGDRVKELGQSIWKVMFMFDSKQLAQEKANDEGLNVLQIDDETISLPSLQAGLKQYIQGTKSPKKEPTGKFAILNKITGGGKYVCDDCGSSFNFSRANTWKAGSASVPRCRCGSTNVRRKDEPVL